MRTKKNNRGNALIPAVFLLMFVAIMGAVLIRGALQSTTLSVRIANIRQSEILAKSAVDYICDKLIDDNTNNLFKELDESISKLTLGGAPLKLSVDINSNTVNSEIVLKNRVETSADIVEDIIVRSYLSYNGQHASLSRKMKITRTKGLGDEKIIGTNIRSMAKNYDITGTSSSKKAKIIGPVKIENGKSVIMTNYIIEGDLHIQSSQAISLTNVEIKGNLYVESIEKPSKNIELSNVKVDGDIVAFCSEDVLTIMGSVECNKMYLSYQNALFLPSFPPDYKPPYITASDIYISNGSANLFTAYTSATVYDSEIGKNAVKAKQRTKATNPDVEITLTTPSEDDCDIILDKENIDDFNNNTLSLSNNVVDIYVGDKIMKDNLMKQVKVSGEGTVNLWLEMQGSALDLSYIDIIRESGNAYINFINLDNIANVKISEKVFDANIINPYGQLDLNNARVRGVVISEGFQFYPITGLKDDWQHINIDTSVAWANIGSLPGLGGGTSVEYVYGSYLY